MALCIEGELRSSQALAQLLAEAGNGGQSSLAFVIGGSYGLHPSIKSAARLRLSMSPMTFPHHLARIMLLEQLYRGYQILEGGSITNNGRPALPHKGSPGFSHFLLNH